MGGMVSPMLDRIASLDKNGDGMIQRDEMMARRKPGYTTMDADTDGQLTIIQLTIIESGALHQ